MQLCPSENRTHDLMISSPTLYRLVTAPPAKNMVECKDMEHVVCVSRVIVDHARAPGDRGRGRGRGGYGGYGGYGGGGGRFRGGYDRYSTVISIVFCDCLVPMYIIYVKSVTRQQ